MSCGCRCDCCLETPQSILDKDDIDVFEEIIPDSESYYTKKREALWARYQFMGIGHTDRAYWLQCMKNRYAQISEQYDLKFKAWTDWLTAQAALTETSFSDYEATTENETVDLPDTPISATDTYLSVEGRTRYKTSGGNDPEKADRWMRAVPNPMEDFAMEFSKQFYYGF